MTRTAAKALLLLFLTAPAVAAFAARPIRVYVAGESIEARNRYVAPPFTSSGALNDRGGGELRNDNEEYGWMVPLRDRLRLRAPDLNIEFVGTDVWANDNDNPYTGTYPTTTPEPTSAISGTSIPSWLEQRRAELVNKTFCYDLAFASRGGNDLGNSNDAEYEMQLQELVLLLANGSACRTDPIIVVTGHMPDDQRSGESPSEYVALELHRFVERARTAVTALQTSNPAVRVRFVDQYTPFLQNTPTTALPTEVWSTGGIPDYIKIGRIDDRYHPRRLASIYVGELTANSFDLQELRALVGDSCSVLPSAAIQAPASVTAGGSGEASVPDAGAGAAYSWTISGGSITGSSAARTIAFNAGSSGSVVLTVSVTTAASCRSTGTKSIPITPSATGPELLLPVVLDVFGESSSHYTTELTLVSRAAAPVAVSLLYTAASGGGSGSAALTLAPGEIRVIGDAIAFLRAQGVPIPSDGASKVGSLRATFAGAASAGEVFLGGRTSTPGGGGTFGLFYPALAIAQTATAPVWVYGLRQDASMRSSLAVVNRGDAGDAVTLRITYFASLAVPLGAPVDVTLAPGEWRQLGRPLEPFGVATGYAKVERLSGSSRFVAYGVLNDAVTSDGSYIGMSVP